MKFDSKLIPPAKLSTDFFKFFIFFREGEQGGRRGAKRNSPKKRLTAPRDSLEKSSMNNESVFHRWNFFKAGGAYQASISTPEDIKNIGSLDKKLWAALACPVNGLSFDKKLLDILCVKNDGKIRHGDIVAAAKWTCENLVDVSVLLDSPKALTLTNINTESEEGRTLLASAKIVLANLGKPDAEEISLSDFDDPQKIFANSAFNADGIITEAAFDDPAMKALFADILSVSEAKVDRSGGAGIDRADIEKFFADAASFVNWQNARNADPAILPLGGATDAAYSLYQSIKAKIDDFFTRVEIVAFDASASAAVNATAEQFAKMLSSDIAGSSSELAALPVSAVSADGVLDLEGAVNPAWKAALANFAESVAKPICGTSKISKAQWLQIGSAFAPFAAWLAANPNVAAEKIGLERLGQIVSENRIAELLEAIDKDASLAQEVENIGKAEKLVRLCCGLCELMRNFVNFQTFYKDKAAAIFQFGELYIDGRMCGLCIKVNDVAKHAAMAALSYGYLLYCVCKRKGEADIEIAAMVTSGDSDNLIVGRNGLFYDRQGRAWDATVTKIVDNPIGIAQAFFAPYKRFVKWISEQIAKRASAADAEATASLQKGAAVDAKTKKLDLGTVAALGVAVGGITTALGIFIEAFLGLGYWLPLGIIGIILAISLPSMILAALKLRMRNLAPLLDANGWAVNNKAGVSIAFGTHLTQTAKRRKSNTDRQK